MDQIKKNFRRLILTSEDLSQAKCFVKVVLKKNLYLEEGDDNRIINRGLQTAAIVSYSRPFSGNYDFEHTTGRISEYHLDSLSQEEIKLHKNICNLRNKVFAHSDSDVRSLKIKTVDFFDSSTAFSISHNPFAPFPKEQWIKFLGIIEKVDGSVSDEIVELQKQFKKDESF